jgi:serine/threonine protein kinase/tetratricopeptide (TPR) repeat protein
MDTDRNLLFGVLALQADLLDRAQFVEACALWANQKQTSLADLLVARGWLTPEDRADVEKLLQRKLRKHGGNTQLSLAELTSDVLRQSLADIGDAEVRRSLVILSATQDGDAGLATTDHVPQSYDRYTLSRLHATGGIGRVWLARDSSLGRDVALKELHPERAGNPAMAARFLREARITGQLEHPGVVPIYEVGRRPEGQQPFYTMRFVRGRTLADAVANYQHRREEGKAGPLELRELLTAVVAVCNAVAFAHSRGVLHRDLKPQNVVLGDYGEAIVLDWGLARLTGQAEDGAALSEASSTAETDGTLQGQVLGTPSYMAPEQAEGRLDLLGPATDVYGLGAILYEVLTGQAPFRGNDTSSVLRQVIHEPPPAPRSLVPDTPRALAAVCLKALAKNPAERYARATDLAGEIQHWLAGEPVSAYREPWAERSRRWLRRHRTLAVSGVATLVVAAVALTASTVLLGAKNDQLARANDRERTANEQLTEANQRERTAREQAQANFALAKDAVEKYLGAVTADPDLKKADFNKLRKKLMQTAVPFYEEFVRQHAADPALEAERGSAYGRLAVLHEDLGELPAAQAAAEQARSVFARLADRFPDKADYRSDLGESLNTLAMIHNATGQSAAAADALGSAADAWRKLVAEHPGEPKYRSQMANCLNNQGVLLHNLGRLDRAEAAYRQALTLREKLADEFPKKAAYRLGLSRTLNSLGTLAADEGKLRESEGYHRRALELREKLAAEEPDNAAYAMDLGISYNNLGSALLDQENYREAVRALRHAVRVREKLIARFPSVVFYRYGQATTLYNLGGGLGQLGEAAEAEAAYRQAIALQEKLLADSPNEAEYRNDLGRSWSELGFQLVRVGRFADAEAALRTALTQLEKATAASPDALAWQVQLGLTESHFGLCMRERGKPDGSLAWYDKAIHQLEPCLKKSADLAVAGGYLRQACAGRAEAHLRLGKPAQAVKDWDRAIELAGREDAEIYRSYRLLATGKVSEALKGVEALAGNKEFPDSLLYPLARVCGWVYDLGPTGDGSKERSAALALTLLRRCHAHGRNPAEWMRHDSAFAPLRQRPDFQKLAAELEARKATSD